MRSILAALIALPLAASRAPAQTGLLVVAHGGGTEWNAGVHRTLAHVQWAHGPVAVAFLMGAEAEQFRWDTAVTRLTSQGAQAIVVVPLMVSSFGSHYRQIEHYAGLRAELPPELASHAHSVMAPPVAMRVSPALDAAPELGEALAARWTALDPADRGRPVLLVAHGPNDPVDAERWLAHLGSVALRLRAEGLTAEIRVGLLRDDAAAEVRAAAIAALRDTVSMLAMRAADSVVVLPLLISTSGINRVRIPGGLGGLPIRYAPAPLAPHPALARWVERVAEDTRHAEVVPPPDTARPPR